MIIIIILLVALLIGLGLLISCLFHLDEVWCYDPNGSYVREFEDITFRSKKEQNKVRQLVETELRKKYNLGEKETPSEYSVRHCDLKVTKIKKLSCYADFDTYRSGFGFGISIMFLIAVLGCGIPCIIHHGPLNQEVYTTKLTVQLDDLHDRQNTIYLTLAGDLNLSVQDDGATYHVIVDKPIDMANTINEYNTDVKAFKQELYLEKCRSASPWTNWFINPGYTKVEGYNASAKTYKDILGDTLKTFELKKI